MSDRRQPRGYDSYLEQKYPNAVEFVRILPSEAGAAFQDILADSTFGDNIATLRNRLDPKLRPEQVISLIGSFKGRVYKTLAYLSLRRELAPLNQVVVSPPKTRDFVQQQNPGLKRVTESPFWYSFKGVMLPDGMITEPSKGGSCVKGACAYVPRNDLRGDSLFRIRMIASHGLKGSTLGPVDPKFGVLVMMMASPEDVEAAQSRLNNVGVRSNVRATPFTKANLDDFVVRVLDDVKSRPVAR